MKALLKRLDSNPLLSQALNQMSTTLAIYRGLPMIAGLVCIVLSLILTGIFIPLIALSEQVADIWLLLCVPALLLHLGLIFGFIGFMMSTPLGKGYRE